MAVGAKRDIDGRDDYLCDDHATSGDVSENARAVENEAARARMKEEQRMVRVEQQELRAASLTIGLPGRGI
jgi:hypothetical protein